MRPTSFVSVSLSPGRGLLPEVRRIVADGRIHFCLPEVESATLRRLIRCRSRYFFRTTQLKFPLF